MVALCLTLAVAVVLLLGLVVGLVFILYDLAKGVDQVVEDLGFRRRELLAKFGKQLLAKQLEKLKRVQR
jgi:hypothetical protein